MTERTCSDCAVSVTRQSKTGRCRRCALRHTTSSPEGQARRLARLRERMTDPDLRAHMSAVISTQRRKRLAEDPAFVEQCRQQGRRLGLSGLGTAAMPPGSEPRMRAGLHVSDRRLPWCPREHRAAYHQLVRKGIPSAEARSAIEEEMRVAEDRLSPFERQMRAVANGARLVEKPVLRSRDPDYTLGGVTDWAA